ncbi:hypothetical protein MPSEU_000471500 [Mayamaea pseudoterrestris]|nr:hypothetical protein MPSEU_000471500 [Mayamaea pseudoterrestris]
MDPSLNNATADAMAEGSNESRVNDSSTHNFLSSAPVSSLLPQLAANGLSFQGQQQQQHQHQPNLLTQAIQQARYAMLLQAAGSLEQQAATANNPLAGLAALSQLANQNSIVFPSSNAGGNHSVASLSSASAPAAAINSAAQLLATHSAVSALTASHHQSYVGQSLTSLENQVKLLHKHKQPVPQTLTLLLADARRREDKKYAKRIANRKSASTSRARKKALVQEMTDLNAKLRRQALILSLLPDLVIVTDADGVINFCSEQVERILQHRSSDLVGSALGDLLVPSSRDKMKKLIRVLIETEASGAVEGEGLSNVSARLSKKGKRQQISEDASNNRLESKEAEITGIPLSVVAVEAGCRVTKAARDGTDNSDASRDSNKQASSLTGSTATDPRSPNRNTGSDSEDNKKTALSDKDAVKSSDKESGGSDDNSNASSLSMEGYAAQDAARKLQSANANLERNVRWHNKNMKACGNTSAEYKDDVIGATVTANNASARLSSLRVHESEELDLGKDGKNPVLSEEEDGYRESNDSREETSSSTFSDTSSKGGRRKPMAPTCNVCLIRDDLTTIWCEVTSSIRIRSVKQEEPFDAMIDEPKSKASASSNASDSDSFQETIKEIYFCLRPIRAGSHKVDEKFRFQRVGYTPVSEGSKTGQSSAEGTSSKSSLNETFGQDVDEQELLSIPPKKRKNMHQHAEQKPTKAVPRLC